MKKVSKTSSKLSISLYTVGMTFCLLLTDDAKADIGDPVTEALLGGISQYVIGNSVANAFDNGNNIIQCNSPSAPSREVNCPNDSTYTPNMYTGGYASWGVGIEPITAIEWGTDCYLVPVFSGGTDPTVSLVLICQSGWNEIPAVTVGRTAARNQWGQITTTASTVSDKISTLAFKASDLPECVTVHNGFTSPCGPDPDVTFVAAPVGYETEVLVDDPRCNMPTFPFLNRRTGTTVDIQYGCFTAIAGNWLSNLPAPYLDTNALDPESKFNSATGSADPAAIMEGFTYDSYVTFYSSGNYVNEINMSARPFGSITKGEPGSAACLGALGAPEFCYFLVDSTPIANSETFLF